MTLEADIERFPLAAAEWEDLSAQILAARAKLEPCRSDGYRFGTLARDVGEAHDLFIGNVYDALQDGSAIALSIAEALQATGRDFGMTDAEQAHYLNTTTEQI